MKKIVFVFVGIILFSFNVLSKTIINLPSQYSTIEVALTNISTSQFDAGLYYLTSHLYLPINVTLKLQINKLINNNYKEN